eukprot:2007569-Alexandrium_andersonii.AAC.1
MCIRDSGRVGDQYGDDETMSNRQRRRLARQQVMAMYAGLVAGLDLLNDSQKAQVIQKNQE